MSEDIISMSNHQLTQWMEWKPHLELPETLEVAGVVQRFLEGDGGERWNDGKKPLSLPLGGI